MSKQIPPAGPKTNPERRILRRILSFAIPTAVLAVILLPTNLSPVWRLYKVPASSMAPTLPVGSFVVASRFSYGLSRRTYDWFDLPISGRWPALSPRLGDVVVFRLPREQRVHYIKRIVGLPGDEVQMRGGRLHINGQAVPKRANGVTGLDGGDGMRRVDRFQETLPNGVTYDVLDEGPGNPLDDTPVFKVPAGHYFMIGDNRDNSADSRLANDYGVGFVPAELLIGKVVFSL